MTPEDWQELRETVKRHTPAQAAPDGRPPNQLQAPGRQGFAREDRRVPLTFDASLKVTFGFLERAEEVFDNETVAAATTAQFPGISLLPTARIGHLIAIKVLAEIDFREHDRADLQALIAAATQREPELARRAVRFTDERGFARGKKLAAVLDAFVKHRT